jgi:hypothetical protein
MHGIIRVDDDKSPEIERTRSSAESRLLSRGEFRVNVKAASEATPYSAATAAADQLIGKLSGLRTLTGETRAALDELAQRIRELPPNLAEDLFLLSSAAAADALVANGEVGAARWHAKQMARRLRRLGDGWVAVHHPATATRDESAS